MDMAAFTDTQIVGGMSYGSGWGLDLIKSNIDVSDDALMEKRKKDFIAFVNEVQKMLDLDKYLQPTLFIEAFNLFFKTDKKIDKKEVK